MPLVLQNCWILFFFVQSWAFGSMADGSNSFICQQHARCVQWMIHCALYNALFTAVIVLVADKT